jgi:hypothetical protein
VIVTRESRLQRRLPQAEVVSLRRPPEAIQSIPEKETSQPLGASQTDDIDDVEELGFYDLAIRS